jgi:hypothetical protein
MALIPSVIHQLVTHPKFDTLDWSSIAAAGSGAAFLPADLSNRFSKTLGLEHFGGGKSHVLADNRLLTVSLGYGLSEAVSVHRSSWLHALNTVYQPDN